MKLLLSRTERAYLPKQADLKDDFSRLSTRRFLPYNDADAYRLLKVATEAFLTVNCGVALKDFKFDGAFGKDLSALWAKYLVTVNGSAGDQTLPYLKLVQSKVSDGRLKTSIFPKDNADLPQDCVGILQDKLVHPCFLELIWSYWHEEGMLVQTLNAISRRFQNIRGQG